MECPKNNCDGKLEDRALSGKTICRKCKSFWNVKALKGWKGEIIRNGEL